MSVPELLVLSGLVFLVAALAQAVTGFGSALVAVPPLGLAAGAADAVVAATLVSLVLTAGAWRREREHVDPGLARTLLVAGVLGLPLGLVLLTVVEDRVLGLLAAGVVLVAVPVLGLARLRPWPGAAGVLSGVLLAGSGMNGPPLVLALRHLEPLRFRATLQAVFCGQDAVATVAFVWLGLVTRDVVVMSAAGLVGLPAGWAVGDAVFRRLSPARLRRAVTVMLLVSVLASGAAHAGLVRG